MRQRIFLKNLQKRCTNSGKLFKVLLFLEFNINISQYKKLKQNRFLLKFHCIKKS